MSKHSLPTGVKRSMDVAVDMVKTSPASIFTKEDVLKLLSEIEVNEPGKTEFTEDQREDLMDFVRGQMEYISADDILDLDSVEFHFEDGNRVRLDPNSVDIDMSYAIDSAHEAIGEWIDRYMD